MPRSVSMTSSHPGQPVSERYKPPFPFTGGRIHSVVVDIADDQYVDAEHLLKGALARD